MSDNLKQEIKELYDVILSLKSQEECENFFSDLCTYTELFSMAQRLKAAKLLIEGKTYEQIIGETEISSATLSRVNKCVKFGNGYSKVLDR